VGSGPGPTPDETAPLPKESLMKSPTRRVLGLLLATVWLGCGCGCGGAAPLSKDLTNHFATRGIKLELVRVHAPAASRAGYVVARLDAGVVTNVVATFKLEKIVPEDRRWQWAVDHAGGKLTAKEVWGVAGRPPLFELKTGGQFEYFYLLLADDGLMYLVAEYSYG
jgi:hypothetical protein